jgi:NAD(P)-dependent dehydrogenase (short-subunit alcohol dehydrogenase family)
MSDVADNDSEWKRQPRGRLAGKVCVITGATGIAEASALRFASEGASLFVIALRADDCRALQVRVAAEVSEFAEFAWSETDLTSESATEFAFASCVETYGRIDGVLASAGGSGRPLGDGPLHATSLESWNATLALNLTTAFLTARESLKVLLNQPEGGSIVFVSSVAATHPVFGLFDTQAYSAAKGGINSLVINAACQYGSNGIRFNAIAPALTATPMSKRAASDPQTLDAVKNRMPLTGGGPLTADDHAQVAVFLCSDESSQITGQVFRVDGGWGVN